MSELFTRNILEEVYQALAESDSLTQLVPIENIWLRRIPEENREQSPVIRITQINWVPYEYSSNNQISYFAEFQIDVWQKQEDGDPFVIGQIIQDIMRKEYFQQSTSIFTDDEDTEMLRDGRRYQGIIII
ncbi:tail completion protein gp17 [Macrococcus capreoli]|uniref:tail completion protein gp17 n=1 Tax=Macrococcus capreoli TaxID=2982690 RepID=UPI0021D5FF72|nr:hypothetical protein [Macrococcus sp. TMW 2.2395]MCU7557256.1 hypothetical protein [Macrococcus sp. TMW 2.2395]